MASRAAFCVAAARVSPTITTSASISVEGLCQTGATVRWSPTPGRAAYIIEYGREGLSSRRVTARPQAKLRNLTPGADYWVRVRGAATSAELATAQLTTMCAEPSPSAAVAADAAEPVPELPLTELSRLEMRVGRIVSVERHPDADSLYVEKIDVGEEEPRTIVSGLVQYVPAEELDGRRVVVLCNLKPRAMRGVTSHGMLMCAGNDDHSKVDPLMPHADAAVGEIVTFEGHKVAPIAPGNRASKAFDRIADDLATDKEGVAQYKGVPFMTKTGPCVSPQKLVGPVS